MKRLASELRGQGTRVTKINFHIGDVLFFSGPEAVPFRGTLAEWPAFIRTVFERTGCDALFLFGDQRPLHREAVRVANALGIQVWVFEEGYLRPEWVTIEKGGVNGRSPLPREPERYRTAKWPVRRESQGKVRRAFARSAWFSTLNALAFTHFNAPFAAYEHHRNLNAWFHTASWLRGTARKQWFQLVERHRMAEFTGPLSKRYVFVPLQVYCDFQLRYSKYEDIVEFIREVTATFAKSGSKDHAIVFKHHPMDRPFREYGALFDALREEHGLGERLCYVHDLNLPTLLKHAFATVTINSTVGLQSIHHGTPVKCLGEAVYDLPGLTDPQPLETFLTSPAAPDESLYRAFREWLLHQNQINGNFYERLNEDAGPTGFLWPPALTNERREDG